MKITFDVKNQILSRTDRQNVIANSTDYLEAEVTFTEDWDGMEKNIQFVNGDDKYTMVLTESDDDKWVVTKQQHLNLNIGTWKVSIIGVSGDTRIVTNAANLSVRASGFIGVDGPVPSVYEQLLTIIQSLHTEAASSAVIRSAVQQYIVDNYDALVKEVVVIDDVRAALDDMAEDGSLSDLLDPLVAAKMPDEVTEQLPDVVAAQIDDVVGDQIDASVASQISAPVTTAVNTYCAANFSTWSGALDSTLTQPLMAAPADKVGELKSALSEINDIELISFISGYYINTNGPIIDVDSDKVASGVYSYAVVDCVEGDLFTITGQASSGNARLWCFIDDDGNIKEKSDTAEIVTNMIVTAPYGATKVIINSKYADTFAFKGINRISALEEKTSVLQKEYSKNLFDPNADGVIDGKYLNTSGVPTDGAGWHISAPIKVSDLESIVGSVWSESGSYYAYCKMSYMHSYDLNMAHIGKIWDESSAIAQGAWNVTSNVAYVRFCWNNTEVASNRKIMVESGSVHSAYYVPYKESNYLTNSAYPTFAETEELIASGGSVPSGDICCWGDSLTYSQYASDDAHRYPYLLASLTGKTVYNWGMPGANSNDIGGLQGGLPIYLDPFTLPASSSDKAEVTLRDANMQTNFIGILHWAPRNGWVNDIQDMGLTWKIDGIPSALSYVSPVMKVNRITTAEEATIYARPIKISSQHEYAKRQIQIFWVGTNDSPNTAEKAQRTVKLVKDMVDYYGGDRYLVLGMTVKDYADECNALFAQTFGNHYVDVKYYLLHYGLSDNSITPTAQDTEDISNGVVPTSLRHDSVHFNDYGYNSIAICVHQHGKDLGYWDDAE